MKWPWQDGDQEKNKYAGLKRELREMSVFESTKHGSVLPMEDQKYPMGIVAVALAREVEALRNRITMLEMEEKLYE